MENNEALKELALQLSQPQGIKGIEIANMMNETNITMTLHAINSLVALNNDSNILELGHGNCGHLHHLLSENKHLTYYGLEISELMNKEAQKVNAYFIESKQAHFSLYDGLNIPFPEDYFNKIFTVNTIYFWENPQALLSELYRVVKENGIVIITFAQKSFMEQLPFTQFGFNLYDTEKIEQLINTSSFKMISTSTQSEMIKSKISKTGESIKREFTTVVLKK